jgi:hypothetical protein
VTPEERREALRQLAVEKRASALSIRSHGPSCLFCKHGPSRSAKGICEHPLFWNMSGEATTDSFSARSMMSTVKARSESGFCGPEAELFRPRFVLSRVWRALRPHLPLFGVDFRR